MRYGVSTIKTRLAMNPTDTFINLLRGARADGELQSVPDVSVNGGNVDARCSPTLSPAPLLHTRKSLYLLVEPGMLCSITPQLLDRIYASGTV